MSARPDRRVDRSGFTLLEVLIAFAVMATLLSVLYRGVVTLHQGATAFDQRTDRDAIARAVLDEALADRDLRPGVHHGVRDGQRWTIIARPIDLSAQLPRPPEDDDKAGSKTGDDKAKKPEWATQRLTVRVDAGGRPAQIDTIRLVRAAP